MATFLAWIMGLTMAASIVVTMASGGVIMWLILAAVLGLSATTAAAGLAIVRAIKDGRIAPK